MRSCSIINTVADLLVGERAYFGAALDAALDLSDNERVRIVEALAEILRGESVNATAEKSAFREEIERLMAERGIESLEELRERFIAAGYGNIDRRDRTTSLWRFELHVNGATGGLNQTFIRGLSEVLELTEEEAKDPFRAYMKPIWGSAPPRRR